METKVYKLNNGEYLKEFKQLSDGYMVRFTKNPMEAKSIDELNGHYMLLKGRVVILSVYETVDA